MFRYETPKTKVCPVCKKKFEATTIGCRYCSIECRKTNWKKQLTSPYTKSETPRKKGSLTLDEVLKELKEYNEKNGTCLSYGQYVSMLHIKQSKRR